MAPATATRRSSARAAAAPALRRRQQAQDQAFERWVHGLDAQALEGVVRFQTLLAQPQIWTVPMRIYLSNLFQHQAHHRGQAHNLLSQEGLDPPPIGFVEFALEEGLVDPPRPAEVAP